MKAVTVEHRQLRRALTVSDLIEQLQEMPEDAIPLFVCDYGDYHHTQQALPVMAVAALESLETVVESAYSQSGLAINSADEEDEEEVAACDEARDDQATFVLLRAERN